MISGRFSKIMVKMAEASEKGSLPHTKYLFDIGGVKEDIQPSRPEQGGAKSGRFAAGRSEEAARGRCAEKCGDGERRRGE